jgi:TonB family protein
MKMLRDGAWVLTLALMAGGVGLVAAQDKGSGAAPVASAAAQAPESVSVQLLIRVWPADRAGLKQYLSVVKKQTMDQWMTMLPAEANPPESTPGVVTIEGWVHTDGRVANMAITQKSGSAALDGAALAAVRSATYDSFPYGLSVDRVKVSFTFNYNHGVAAGPGSTPVHGSHPVQGAGPIH